MVRFLQAASLWACLACVAVPTCGCSNSSSGLFLKHPFACRRVGQGTWSRPREQLAVCRWPSQLQLQCCPVACQGQVVSVCRQPLASAGPKSRPLQRLSPSQASTLPREMTPCSISQQQQHC